MISSMPVDIVIEGINVIRSYCILYLCYHFYGEIKFI